jgi:hypothetical protein
MAVEAGRLELSIIDHRPEELLAASLTGVSASYAARLGAGGLGERVVLDVGGLQVDDMAFAPRYPVVLAPLPSLPAASATPRGSAGGGGARTSTDLLLAAPDPPLLHAIALARRGSQATGGGAFYPLLGAWVDRTLALAVGEGFVWRCAAAAARLAEGSAAAAAAAGASATTPSTSTPAPSPTTEAETDPPVRAALVVAGPITAAVSFRADRAARPRWARRRVGAAAWVLDVASFERAPVRMAGFEAEGGSDLAAPRSAFWGGLAGRARAQAVGAGLALVRSVDVLSSTAGVLGALSDGVAGLASDTTFAAERAAARGERSITGVGSGLAEGGGALGRGILRGVTGLVARPLEGALATGVAGFMRGVGSGLVGAVTQPVAGGLDFVSSALEGLDALAGEGSRSGATSNAGSVSGGGGGAEGGGTAGRARLPRVARGGPAALGLPPGSGGGEGRPVGGPPDAVAATTTATAAGGGLLLGGAAGPAARMAELGQDLLRRAAAATAVAAASGPAGPGSTLPPGAGLLLGGDSASGAAASAAARAGGSAAYGAHWALPGDRAAVATDAGLALLSCPGLGALQRAAESGSVSAPALTTPVTLWWVVAWRDVLAAEARPSAGAAAAGRVADRVVLHRVGGGGGSDGSSLDASLPLAIGIKTSPAYAQADALAGALECAAACARGEGARAEAAAWERVAAGAAGGAAAATPMAAAPSASPTMPLALPCVDFALVWHTAGRPGSVAAGAGATLSGGAPVSVWRPLPPAGYASAGDVAVPGLEPPPAPVSVYRMDTGGGGGGGGGGTAAAAQNALPPAAPAAGFRLIWRGTGALPVTLWEPRPPPGYVALGAVARGSPSPPRGWRARARALARPPTSEVACLRADLVEDAPLFAAPLWRWDPAAGHGAGLGAPRAAPPYDPASWQVAIWQVDSPAGGFIAERSFEDPGAGAAMRPVVREDGEKE